MVGKIKYALIFSGQLAILWGLNQFGVFLSTYFKLPIPGNVIGMILLFMLLISGVIKLEWINEAASFLLKHLVFFFIPIAVGIMTFGTLLKTSGLTFMMILIISASLGIIVTGIVSQWLMPREEGE